VPQRPRRHGIQRSHAAAAGHQRKIQNRQVSFEYIGFICSIVRVTASLEKSEVQKDHGFNKKVWGKVDDLSKSRKLHSSG